MTVLPATLHPEQRLTISQVEALTGRKKSWLYDRIKIGAFVAPERDGPRCTRWRAADVLEWLESRQGAQ